MNNPSQKSSKLPRLSLGFSDNAPRFTQPALVSEGPSEVAIIGAGPYALSLAAHLRGLGVTCQIIGIPMQTWLTEMPKGMFLKSDGFASNLYDPDNIFTLESFYKEKQLTFAGQGLPISLESFCDYGMAFQKRFVPNLEHNLVSHLKETHNGFSLKLDDGREFHSKKVVLATGIGHFKFAPEWFHDLPSEYWAHSSACTDPSRFAKREVAIIGAGSSALDLAALLQEAGAKVRLIARKSSVNFHTGPSSKARRLWQRLLYPTSGLGPSIRSLLYSEAPHLFHYLPLPTRTRVARNYLGPAGGWFIRDRVVGKVEMLLGQNVQCATVQGSRVRLSLLDANGISSEIITDYVIAATGYKIDMRRLPFLDSGLFSKLKMINHAPQLSPNFETSVLGLHVIGPASVNSFGPVMRFAFGARFTARRLSNFLGRTRALRPLSRSIKPDVAMTSIDNQ